MVAAKEEHGEIVKLFLEKGAEVDLFNKAGRRLLWLQPEADTWRA